MNSSDTEHLKKAIELLHLFLMNGLVATKERPSFPPKFINSMSVVISNAMGELWQLSSETKERMSFISWDFVERMRDPLEAEKEFVMNPMRISSHLRMEVPMFLDKAKNILDEEE